ncbi:MAG TPA: glycosyltransferase family 2 protein [bacterium]|nr:glycosyltransferase family 2 protein [bacterium]HPL95499.1 glycosyltransferase family 2 protein [bacterium]
MFLNIIIVSWNTRELTLKCLKSVFEYMKKGVKVSERPVSEVNWKIYLVDNNSTDGTVRAVQEFLAVQSGLKTGVTDNGAVFNVTPNFSSDNLEIIINQKNVGFAKANNQALNSVLLVGTGRDLSRQQDNYILLLNPDTEFISDKILAAIDFMIKNKNIGILGPQLLNSDGTLQRSCRQFPKLSDQLLIQLKFYNFWPEKFKAARQYFMLDFNHDKNMAVDQVMGAAMLIKKEVIEKIGLFDEKFWAIFEEVDFCKRAKDVGYQIYFYPAWQIIHHKEQSFKHWPSLRKQINFNRSLYHYFKKHKPFWQFFILWLAQPTNLFLTIIDSIAGIRKKVGKSKDL